MSTDLPHWHPQDPRPEVVAFAIRNSNTIMPWSGTEQHARLNDYLVRRVAAMHPDQLHYLRDLYEMFRDGFDAGPLAFYRATDPDAYDLHCALCAFTMAGQANRLPI